MSWRHTAALFTLLLAGSSSAAQERAAYSVDSARSKLEIAVYKEGFFRAFGHNHLIAAKVVSGRVEFDAKKVENSSVSLKVLAASLSVVDPGESEKDRKDVQATMAGEKVLDVAKYPQITFTSTGVLAIKPKAEGWELTLSGRLNLHGVEKAVSFPLRLRKEGEGLRAQGEVSLLQTDHGITPVKVAGGTVKVKDRVKISFDILASKPKK
ncbi:MAG TPA: YceI family protein [Candidatus Limnocylindria bacterium]|nr:YceI family protein [Candidatus Limnocylindria bacterium]